MNRLVSIWIAVVLSFYWFNLVWTVPCSNINNHLTEWMFKARAKGGDFRDMFPHLKNRIAGLWLAGRLVDWCCNDGGTWVRPMLTTEGGKVVPLGAPEASSTYRTAFAGYFTFWLAATFALLIIFLRQPLLPIALIRPSHLWPGLVDGGLVLLALCLPGVSRALKFLIAIFIAGLFFAGAWTGFNEFCEPLPIAAILVAGYLTNHSFNQTPTYVDR